MRDGAAHGITWCGAVERNTRFIELFKHLKGGKGKFSYLPRHCNDTCILLWLQICQFLCWQTDGQNRLLHPLRMRGVIMEERAVYICFQPHGDTRLVLDQPLHTLHIPSLAVPPLHKGRRRETSIYPYPEPTCDHPSIFRFWPLDCTKNSALTLDYLALTTPTERLEKLDRF